MAVAWFDFRYMQIPNLLNVAIFAMGVAAAFAIGHITPLWAVASAITSAAVMWLFSWGYNVVRGRVGLGLGDVKLIGASAAWIGLAALPSLLLFAAVGGLVYVGMQHLIGRSLSFSSKIPFGPFIGTSLLMVWFAGPLHLQILV